MTSTSIKFKCKSWIDTMGQRGSKATGSLLTNAFSSSMADLVRYDALGIFCYWTLTDMCDSYGNLTGVLINIMLILVARYMGRLFYSFCARLFSTKNACNILGRSKNCQKII